MKINLTTLYKLITEQYKKPIIDGFQVIEDEITSSDVEDGGADHTMVIKDTINNKYYRAEYCDWDIDNTDYDYDNEVIDGRCDINDELKEVFPKQIVKTIYV